MIAGSLTASLTYSGGAAIHAAFLVWLGPAAGELDVYPLSAILSSSCLIAVPLINWSSTLRNFGKKQRGPYGVTQYLEKSTAQVILIYWSILVAVGFLSIFVALEDDHGILPFAATLVDYSKLEQIQCTPPNSSLNQSAGQLSEWDELWITSEFISQNNCVEPCSGSFTLFGGSLFRSNNDLQSLTAVQIDRNWEKNHLTSKEAHADFFAYLYLNWGLFTLPYIILQGLWATLFQGDFPAEARHRLFIFLTDFHFPGTFARPIPQAMAKFLAILAYAWALFVFIICPPVFALNLIASEIKIHPFPQSELANHVGAWTPWAATALVLIAAFIARFHYSAVDMVVNITNHAFYEIGHQWHVFNRYMARGDVKDSLSSKNGHSSATRPTLLRAKSEAPEAEILSQLRDVPKDFLLDFVDEIQFWFKDGRSIIGYEWKSFFLFYSNPEKAPSPRNLTPRNKTRTQIREELRSEKQLANDETLDNLPTTGDYRHTSMISTTSRRRQRPKFEPGYLPGGDKIRKGIKSVGLEDHIDIGGEGSSSRQVRRARTESERRRRSMQPLPPVSKNVPKTPTPTIKTENDSPEGSTHVTIGFQDAKYPDTPYSDNDVLTPLPGQAWNGSTSPPPFEITPHSSQTDVLSSLHRSINGRQRRSQAYSPGIIPSSQTGSLPPPSTSRYIPSSSSPPPTHLPNHISEEEPPENQDLLFTPAEMTQLLATPPSRSPLLPSSARNSAVFRTARAPSPRVPGRRSTVSYLQVQRPTTMMFGDEIVLRKDEWGGYHVVEREGEEKAEKDGLIEGLDKEREGGGD